ncbi:hypothetical protein [Haliangium ochraceum]|uniref:Uncharacterized protein n=1 Tax=Haliangium ochraceum (strain DSM 14365 / JCM 11303 / SMP-2) TaxID=502025 RepID=D0LVW6_HALO1|nr:hypothetical protein [Haliangium ochraceum]ACY14100.1 hypothetical protein Hoch_1548 [Haliangium ochraceum DSM 14365]
MTTTTGILLKGVVQVEVRKRNGDLVERRVVHNRIVDRGMELMSLLLVSSFVNETSENVTIRPLQAIGVGTATAAPPPGGGVPPVDFLETQLGGEWTRRRIEQVEILRAELPLRAADATTEVLRLQSRIQGAYGNRVQVAVINASSPYELRVSDNNAVHWNGTAWVSESAEPRTHTGESLRDLLASIASDPVLQASAANLDWDGTLETLPDTSALRNGGTGLLVSATFSNTGGETQALTEAALFTSEDAADATGKMFNMVRFPVISVTSELDVTFRWKILFQEAASAS